MIRAIFVVLAFFAGWIAPNAPDDLPPVEFGIRPPEERPDLAVEDFPECIVKVNGEVLPDEVVTFQAGETIEVEVELTYRDGVAASRVIPVILHLMVAAENEYGEEMATYRPTQVLDQDEKDVAANVLFMKATWELDIEPGTYELRLCSGFTPEDLNVDRIPVFPVYSSIVEVRGE